MDAKMSLTFPRRGGRSRQNVSSTGVRYNYMVNIQRTQDDINRFKQEINIDDHTLNLTDISIRTRRGSQRAHRALSSTGVQYNVVVDAVRTQEDIQRFKKELDVDDHKLAIWELSERYGTDIVRGLTKQRADELLAQNGPNCLIPPAAKSRLLILAEYLFCGFATLLWAGAILTFIGYSLAHMKNPRAPKDPMYLGILLVTVIFITGFFGYYQEVQNAKIMDSFKKMIPKQATVIRDGQKIDIPSEELVVGDLVEMKMGDCVPADVRIVSSESMKVDNSSITGESLPQTRAVLCTDDNPMETANLAFYSTFVVEGNGMGIVICTGDDTLIGHIAGLTSAVEKIETPLKKEIRRFVVFITILAFTFGAVFFGISMFIGYDIFTSLTYFIAIIVANVPEGLPVTLTACMTLTARRMAKKNCLVKNIQAIEALGSCNVICSDKTGTLTQNRMTVAHVYCEGQVFDVLEDPVQSINKNTPGMKALCNVAILCSRSKFDEETIHLPIPERKVLGDASEASILKFMEILMGDVVKMRDEFPKVCEIPFKSANKFQVSIHKLKTGKFLLVMKGAPERVLECSSTMIGAKGESVAISAADIKMIKQKILNLGNLGERVLGFADLNLPDSFGPGYVFNADKPNFPLTGLRFAGLMSMIDPPRPSVPEAVEKCKTAGIRVIMVTGDHPITAKAIAKKVGIISEDAITVYDIALQRDISASMVTEKEKAKCNAAVITGADLREMDETELETVLLKYNEIVFARTTPQQKLKIVEALQGLDNIVAVTGDGVNDSPALKKGDIGIAMGITGSDVSKETADMILLDDNFASIVTGIEEGRLIFDNLKKSIAYILTSNVPEIVPFLLLVIINIPQALSVMAIMVIDVGTDLWPAISLAYEKAEADIMKRKPRDMKRDKLVNFRMIYLTYFQIGIIQTAASMISYFFVMAQHGFTFQRLLGIRVDWEEHWLNDLEDSEGEEWTYQERMILQYKGHSAYFLSIVVTQVADLLICKTRRLSLFQQGMNNWALNFGIIFEVCLAIFVVYCPYLNRVLQFAPISGVSILLAVPFAIIILCYDELRKFLIRKNPTGIVYRETYY